MTNEPQAGTEKRRIIDYINQVDVARDFRRALTSTWTTVEESTVEDSERMGRHAAFCDPGARSSLMSRGPGWPHGVARPGPATVEYMEDGDTRVEYLPEGNDDGIHALVITQTFYAVKIDPLPRLMDEFVLFHNLWRDDSSGSYVKILDDGSEEPAAFFDSGRFNVRTSLVREFQAARQWDLMLFVDSVRYHTQTAGLDLDTIRHDVVNDLENTCLAGSNGRSFRPFTRFFGIRTLPPPSSNHARPVGTWGRTDEVFPVLIVGIDNNGNPERVACGPRPDPNDFLTTVQFRREVLRPYYDQPAKYTVDESGVSCGQLWSFRVYSTPPGNLSSMIGDFGEELPEAERIRWASFNVVPEHPSITDPLRRDLARHPMAQRGVNHEFARRYDSLNRSWAQRFGWPLFTQRSGDDVHLLKRVRVPLDDGVAEFEEQLGILARLVVDYLNESEIVRAVGKGDPNEKGIGKLERFLAAEQLDASATIITLRDVQLLRSKVAAHRKTDDTWRLIESKLGTRDTVAAVMQLLIRLCEALRSLEEQN